MTWLFWMMTAMIIVLKLDMAPLLVGSRDGTHGRIVSDTVPAIIRAIPINGGVKQPYTAYFTNIFLNPMTAAFGNSRSEKTNCADLPITRFR